MIRIRYIISDKIPSDCARDLKRVFSGNVFEVIKRSYGNRLSKFDLEIYRVPVTDGIRANLCPDADDFDRVVWSSPLVTSGPIASCWGNFIRWMGIDEENDRSSLGFSLEKNGQIQLTGKEVKADVRIANSLGFRVDDKGRVLLPGWKAGI